MTYPFFCDMTLPNTPEEPIPNFNKIQTQSPISLRLFMSLFSPFRSYLPTASTNLEQKVKNKTTIPILREKVQWNLLD